MVSVRIQVNFLLFFNSMHFSCSCLFIIIVLFNEGVCMINIGKVDACVQNPLLCSTFFHFLQATWRRAKPIWTNSLPWRQYWYLSTGCLVVVMNSWWDEQATLQVFCGSELSWVERYMIMHLMVANVREGTVGCIYICPTGLSTWDNHAWFL